MFSGIISINKPAGMRSTSCVNMVKRILGKKIKVGHAGTLDAPAEGVLLIVTGTATRLSQYLMELPKIYEVAMTLGCRTDTDDYTGNILSRNEIPPEVNTRINNMLFSFQGVRMQVPPRVSAVKIKGERAHKMSRNGQDFRISARPVSVSRIRRPNHYKESGEVALRIHCHKGTYIRSIARDMGDLLECGAFVSSLTRSQIGPFNIADRKCVQNIEEMDQKSIMNFLQPIDSFLGQYTTYEIPSSLLDSVKNGNPVEIGKLSRTGWGIIPSFISVALIAEGFISMGRVYMENHKLYVKPATNIFLTGVKE